MPFDSHSRRAQSIRPERWKRHRGHLSSLGTLFRLGDRIGGIDEPDVAERLREVSEELSGARVHLLSEEPNVIAERHCGAKRLFGSVKLASESLGLSQPKGAQQE